jgi:CRP-like cAMP-binding protein
MHASIFEGIAEATRRRILESSREEPCAPGDFIFRQGQPAHHLFILAEGRVRMTQGRGELLAYVASEPNDLIGWSALLENATYTASAQCLAPVKVLRIEKQILDHILSEDTASGMVFYKTVVAIIGRRLMKSYEAMLSLHGLRESQPGG